jgi:hypothetical protein
MWLPSFFMILAVSSWRYGESAPLYDLYHQSVLEIINLFIYHSVLLIGLLSCSSSKLSFRQACYTGETDVHTAARPDFENN